MSNLILKNCLVKGNLTDITIEDGKIKDIGKTDKEGIDIGGKKVYPGLVDIHIHGLIGEDTMDTTDFSNMSSYLAKNGITSWYPTTMTVPFENIKKVVNESVNHKGANVLGFHIEGPYINLKYKGAQNAEYIKNPDIEEFNQLKRAKLVTIAPELEGSEEFIKKCDAVVCLGHSAADYDIADKAMKNGANCLTHTFNAMSPLHHRKPGMVGAASDNNAYVQVICDGIHLHPAVVRILYKIFGKDRMILISDCMRATRLDDGDYDFGGQLITVKDRVARTQEGAIAGSTSLLVDCVRKAVEFGIPEEDAFYMASHTPSEIMGINKGRIEKGYDADLIVVDDKLDIKMTIIGGKVEE